MPDRGEMKRNPALGGVTKAIFYAINEIGCVPKRLAVLHRGEVKRDPEKMMFFCSLEHCS